MTVLTRDELVYVLDRLHRPYIEAVAAEIRETVGRRGRPVALAYEPGDGTSYRLVFTPLDVSPVTERVHHRRGWTFRGEDPDTVVEEPYGVETNLGVGEPDGRYALVSLVEHGAYPFELFDTDGVRGSGSIESPDYVSDKLGIENAASAVAVSALLLSISGAEWPTT